MAYINMDSIMQKVKRFAESPSGKKKMEDAIKEKRKGNNGRLMSGDYIITESDMINMAVTLIETMKEEASLFEYALPQSVLDHFNSLSYTLPKSYDNGKRYIIEIYFQDDLSRMSLLIKYGERKGQRTGDGIKNIVSLYDTGYKSSKHVRGVWNGHEEDGVILSRAELEGRYFIERALESFNRKYGNIYHLEAIVTASPDFYSNFNYDI